MTGLLHLITFALLLSVLAHRYFPNMIGPLDKAPTKILYTSASGSDKISFTQNMHQRAAAGFDSSTSAFIWCLASLTSSSTFGKCYRFVVGTDTEPKAWGWKLGIGSYSMVRHPPNFQFFIFMHIYLCVCVHACMHAYGYVCVVKSENNTFAVKALELDFFYKPVYYIFKE